MGSLQYLSPNPLSIQFIAHLIHSGGFLYVHLSAKPLILHLYHVSGSHRISIALCTLDY